MRKFVIAMLLAGGRGTRLSVLTKGVAKPAVPFGGKYRIIDFALSNCTNSRINTVGVLTQYEPHELNSYIGKGSSWDLDRRDAGGVTVLSPYTADEKMKWFHGTAGAIYQHMNYIHKYSPEHVLILSGDHIYKMDYSKMLKEHIEKNADVTISVIEVPWEDAGRYGIMQTDEEGRIVAFKEKPAKPESNLASMGIYIFKTSVLQAYLEADDQDEKSSHDFGKDIIPTLISDGKNVFSYAFQGYWKDVGTVSSLWEANMDLVNPENTLHLDDKNWPIYSRNYQLPPQYISEEASVKNSLVNEGCVIEGDLEETVVFQDVYIHPGSYLKQCVVMPGVIIEKNVHLEGVIIPPRTHVHKGTQYIPEHLGEILFEQELMTK